MNILVISSNYPSPENPTVGTFVHETVKGFKGAGHNVMVISPKTIMKNDKEPLCVDYEGIRIIQPRHISLSNKKIIGSFSTVRFSDYFFLKSVVSKISLIQEFDPDICYAHFLYGSGNAACELNKKLAIPYILSLGESTFSSYADRSSVRTRSILEGATKIITVSKALARVIEEANNVYSEKVVHVPNGIDLSKFQKLGKENARKALGIPNKKTIIFVGHFIHRKGPDRLLKAIQKYDIDVNIIFIGKGPIQLNDKRIIFQGKVRHGDLPMYYNAADLFVLPTLAEGMPNATLEAMACGLPVISSNLEFNYEFLRDNCSVLVDPNSIDEIGQAIQNLVFDDVMLEMLSENSKKVAVNYDVRVRTNNILRLMK